MNIQKNGLKDKFVAVRVEVKNPASGINAPTYPLNKYV